jgi:hypothetical protein
MRLPPASRPPGAKTNSVVDWTGKPYMSLGVVLMCVVAREKKRREETWQT